MVIVNKLLEYDYNHVIRLLIIMVGITINFTIITINFNNKLNKLEQQKKPEIIICILAQHTFVRRID